MEACSLHRPQSDTGAHVCAHLRRTRLDAVRFKGGDEQRRTARVDKCEQRRGQRKGDSAVHNGHHSMTPQAACADCRTIVQRTGPSAGVEGVAALAWD